ERETNGLFRDVYDLMSRVNLRSANKKTFESLIMAGAFDPLGKFHRAQYFAQENGKISFLEALIKFGNAIQDASTQGQNSLFGETLDHSVSKPQPMTTAPWSRIELINKEKEVAGFYISGHPLDDFKFDIDNFCTHKISDLNDLTPLKGKEISFGGLVIGFEHRQAQNGNAFGNVTIEDYTGNIRIFLFKENYLKWKHFLAQGTFLHIKAKVAESFRNDGSCELRPSQIQLLAEMREKMVKSLTLRIPIHSLSKDSIKHMLDVFSTHPGKCNLKVTLIDTEENMKVDLVSKKIKLQLSNDFIHQLETFNGIGYKLN